MKLTLHRRGTAEVSTKTPNQCKEIGWTSLNYIVRVTAEASLDEHGYLLRHEAIHDVMREAIALGGSCEQIAREALTSLVEECAWHKHIKLYKVVVRIIPNMDKPMAFMEAEYEAVQ